MKTQSNKFFILSFFILFDLMYLLPQGLAATPVDHSIFAFLLMRHVNQGDVDYQSFKREESKLDQYLNVLEKTPTHNLSRDEQFAFYINAYNAWTIKLIFSGYPGIKSIKELGSFIKSPWEKKICRIDGDVMTLDHIEHNILRPRFKDPRVHFAINCAALSCPPLRSEPYIGSELDHQLDDAATAFINNPKRNYLSGDTLYVSKIFKWFAKDFNDDVIGFFLKYANEDIKKELEAKKDNIKIKYLHYDWSLNGK